MLRIRGFLLLIFVLLIIIFIAIHISDSLTFYPLMYLGLKIPSYETYAPDKTLNGKDLAADNPLVVDALKRKYVFPPSLKSYNLEEPDFNPSMGQAQKIDRILNKMENGFYIECGALDGETRSNTLFFERNRKWNGLLIEADPKNFEIILTKNRKAFASPTCLAPSQHPTTVSFQQQQNMGHIVGKLYHPSGGPELGQVLEVQCFPFLSFIKALNVTSVDYFSLDVEGAEFDILKSIPWDRVDIKTLSVEFIHNREDKDSIEDFMREQGYLVHSEVTHAQWLANDFIFVRKDLFNKLLQQ